MNVVNYVKQRTFLTTAKCFSPGIRMCYYRIYYAHIIKAVALGAKAVVISRPFIYAYSAYGEEGMDRAMEILGDEFETCLRLLGARSHPIW